MNKQRGIILGVVAVLIIVGGVYASTNRGEVAVMEPKMESTSQTQSDVMVKNDIAMENNAPDNMETGDTIMKEEGMEKSDVMMKGSYEAYAPEKLAKAETGDVVLFFHASWCPSCRGLNASIESNGATIPEGITILKTDFDKETELKKKYGVTYQHTLVQVSADGTMIKKWSGSPSLERLLSEIQ
jgi:thiol-disulfide isomerase/thioredoxin